MWCGLIQTPKVITQILDQMIPLRTLYGVKNVLGILSTYNSWRFFKWVPEGENLEESDRLPQELEELNTRNYPPPSPRPYSDTDADGDEDDNQDEVPYSSDNIKRGTLYASDIISDGPIALKVLAWVLGEMKQTPIANIPAHKRDYLLVVRKDATGGYAKLQHTPDYYRADAKIR